MGEWLVFGYGIVLEVFVFIYLSIYLSIRSAACEWMAIFPFSSILFCCV